MGENAGYVPADEEAVMVGHAVPPVLLMASGIVLWISAAVASAGSAVQTNGVTLLVLGIAWLVAELRYARQPIALLERPAGDGRRRD